MNLNPIPGTAVAFKALVAYKSELAVTASIVLDASVGVYGAVVPEGTLINPLVSGRYVALASGDEAVVGTTKILAQTVTCDGAAMTSLAGFYGGYFNVAAIVGTPAQIAAISTVVEPGVVVMKQW